MIGGGPGAFIGAVHRIAARMDNFYELVAGCFSSSMDKSMETAEEVGIAKDRVYENYEELIIKEKQLPEELRVQVICIVTPNHVHFEPAKLALENGFHVILDKPITLTLTEALELKRLKEQSGKELLLTHTYTGYPMVKEARQQLASKKLGEIKKVYVEYPQGWLSTPVESKQAGWRTDPSKSGIAGAMGDIGTHAFNLAEYVTSLQVVKVCADINTIVENRKLDDDGAVLLKFNNGASGVLMASQVAAGEENKVKIRVYGESGGLEWHQEEANSLVLKYLNQPTQVLRTGSSYLSSFAAHNTRTPAGHPEGYLEAFANLYRNFALTILCKEEGKTVPKEYLDFPSVDEGTRGMAFIETVIASGKSNEKWIELTI